MTDRIAWARNNSIEQEESLFKVGDIMIVMLEPQTIIAFEEYNGPFDFVSRIARFQNGSGMSLTKGHWYRKFVVACGK